MHEMTVRVYSEDTDFGGVVYHANHLRFLERGRTEALRAMGVDQAALKEAGVLFVVRRADIDYLAPARFDDVLTVRTGVSWVRRASASMRQEIRRGDVRLVRAEIMIACMAPTGRPTRFPPEVRAFLVQRAGDS